MFSIKVNTTNNKKCHFSNTWAECPVVVIILIYFFLFPIPFVFERWVCGARCFGARHRSTSQPVCPHLFYVVCVCVVFTFWVWCLVCGACGVFLNSLSLFNFPSWDRSRSSAVITWVCSHQAAVFFHLSPFVTLHKRPSPLSQTEDVVCSVHL